MTAIEVKNLFKTYRSGGVETSVLNGITLRVRKGEWLAIMGRSGAGKSTLVYQMSLLDNPTSGTVVINGEDTNELSDEQKIRMRLNKFGFVFQEYALMPELTALENVVVPLLMKGDALRNAEEKAAKALTSVGLGERLGNLPSQLSGGEQQRVSIARAIAGEPSILFADEPTANLDRLSSKTVLEIFAHLHERNQTIVMVTHEEEYGRLAERVVVLDDGRIISDEKQSGRVD